MRPDPIPFPETRELVYELRMTSDADGADFTVDAVATVETGPRGHFRLEWEAPRQRVYKLRALYDKPSPGLAADETCPQFASIASRAAEPDCR